MLQSLGKRMKRFYKYDYCKNENRVQNFRKASELIKQVNQKTVTPSVYSSLQDIDDSSNDDFSHDNTMKQSSQVQSTLLGADNFSVQVNQAEMMQPGRKQTKASSSTTILNNNISPFEEVK